MTFIFKYQMQIKDYYHQCYKFKEFDKSLFNDTFTQNLPQQLHRFLQFRGKDILLNFAFVLHCSMLFNHLFLSLWLIVLDNQSISNSQLKSICVIHDNAASRASCGWWLGIILRRAALAPVDKESTSPAHFARLLGLQVERAGSLSGLVHDVDACCKFVGCCRQRASVHNALIVWVEVPFSLPTVCHCIDCPFSRASSESPCVLVEVVSHWRSGVEGFATISCARSIRYNICIITNKITNNEGSCDQESQQQTHLFGHLIYIFRGFITNIICIIPNITRFFKFLSILPENFVTQLRGLNLSVDM